MMNEKHGGSAVGVGEEVYVSVTSYSFEVPPVSFAAAVVCYVFG